MAKRIKKPTIVQQIMAEVTAKLKNVLHDSTRIQYLRHTKAFVRYCREAHDSRSLSECLPYVQEYCDYLVEKGYTPPTVHTYIAAVCKALEIDLATINKPVRHTADYVRGRSKRDCGASGDLSDPRWAYVVEFNRCVGIRREELMQLRGRDFALDESGHPCVFVRRGKGGKPQLQRIDEKDAPFVMRYFDAVEPNEFLFDRKLFNNDLNFHSLRAEDAKAYYFSTLRRIQNEPGYAAQLEQEIRARWDLYCKDKRGRPRRLPDHEIYGYYVVRGRNRALAAEKGMPMSYHKLALLATSVFKLSHWRNDVTVASYLLA